MKLLSKLIAPAGLALCALATTVPAQAQVQGRIASAQVSRAVISSTAFQTAYNQVTTTYQAQLTSRQTKQQELRTLLQPFDSNGNGQLDEAELPAVQQSPNVNQIQTLQGDIDTISAQVNAARIYIVEQILAQYPAALNDVTTQQQIVMVIQPEVIQWGAQGFDITDQVATALNTRVPSVGVVPPTDWRPRRDSVAIFEEIQQTLLTAQLIQQQQAAQQQQATQPAPTGR